MRAGKKETDTTVFDALVVTVEPGAPVADALRELKRQVRAVGLLVELRRRAAFTPRSTRRRAKAHRARQRARRAANRRG